jgi:putative acetyltransferase
LRPARASLDRPFETKEPIDLAKNFEKHASRSPEVIWQPSDKLLSAKPEVRNAVISMRLEEPQDAAAIRDLLQACFAGYAEADLVEGLRRDGDLVLSLVAEDDGILIGYIAFSRLIVEHEGEVTPAVALAPLAVYPDYQSQGVATRLVREAHACLAAMGEKLSVVLGEPHYYGRFGYSHRRASGFRCVYQSPYLMAISFGAAPWEGRLVYPPAFNALSEDAPLQADGRI